MKYVKGDLIKLALSGEFDVITHGCNCFCTFGAGIAKQIKQHFPEAYKQDLLTKSGDRKKLGTCTAATTKNNLIIVNSYIQYDYSSTKICVNYNSVRDCMKYISENFKEKRIGMPKIGCGLAGGKWYIVEKIIEEELTNMDITVVEYVRF